MQPRPAKSENPSIVITRRAGAESIYYSNAGGLSPMISKLVHHARVPQYTASKRLVSNSPKVIQTRATSILDSIFLKNAKAPHTPHAPQRPLSTSLYSKALFKPSIARTPSGVPIATVSLPLRNNVI